MRLLINLNTGEEMHVSDDIVEVVRCKDCKYHEDLEAGGVKCGRIEGLLMIFPNDYCSYGRRRTEE